MWRQANKILAVILLAAMLGLGLGAHMSLAALPGITIQGYPPPANSLTVQGLGFQPRETITVVFSGPPDVTTTATARRLFAVSGGYLASFTATLVIPVNVALGSHTITATGQTSGRVA